MNHRRKYILMWLRYRQNLSQITIIFSFKTYDSIVELNIYLLSVLFKLNKEI